MYTNRYVYKTPFPMLSGLSLTLAGLWFADSGWVLYVFPEMYKGIVPDDSYMKASMYCFNRLVMYIGFMLFGALVFALILHTVDNFLYPRPMSRLSDKDESELKEIKVGKATPAKLNGHLGHSHDEEGLSLV
eukprot:gnl/Hemi2/26084_TR8752_c0_g3_i2.p3 gnl/Hemi2/26084_TR8752_c0_g3~~gnl/Hemi2/26084_TR8752_c0_g3_i2.p3  ORF type:complete len:132 (+),score=65.79 gnl/Hemi2/26084_TR8752_c0_g3_i2:861-1256(+)